MIEAQGITLPQVVVPSDAAASTSPTPPNASPAVLAARAARSAAGKEAAEEARRRSLYEWYREVIALARGNVTLRSGGTMVLPRDADRSLVWVRTSKGAGPTVVLACNLSGQPVTFSLVEDVQRLHLRGSFLRTMLRSDEGMGAMPLRSVSLPAYGVYIGELRR